MEQIENLHRLCKESKFRLACKEKSLFKKGEEAAVELS